VVNLGGGRFGGAGLVATLGEGHFCDGIGGYFGRRSFLWRGLVAKLGVGRFLWRDWWLCWEKGIFVAGLVATYVGRRAFLWRDY
jgi:hypothetical protein